MARTWGLLARVQEAGFLAMHFARSPEAKDGIVHQGQVSGEVERAGCWAQILARRLRTVSVQHFVGETRGGDATRPEHHSLAALNHAHFTTEQLFSLLSLVPAPSRNELVRVL